VVLEVLRGGQQQQQQAVQGGVRGGFLVIDQRLPGGRGSATPFFQLRNSPVKHTYGSILLAGSSGSSSIGSSKGDDASSKAGSAELIRIAQSYVAAQLNQLSGVVMPQEVRQAQVTLAAKYFSVVDGRGSVKQELQQKAAAADAVLSSFNRGKMQGIPSCKQLQAS
jgi:hypothetical protein